MSEEKKAGPKGTVRRDRLCEIETRVIAQWEKEKAFEVNCPPVGSKEFEEENKFMVTFPYPYMNGRLHLGHVFTLTKAEFAVGYYRMKGKTCLFPFSFHVTGMPIQAAAMKLKAELAETVGVNTVEQRESVADVDAAAKKFSGKKTKAAQKSGGAKTQYEIMVAAGIPVDEIPLFVDPVHWTKFFPRCALQDLRRFGLKVDWRRSFVTTELNPYYDSFIRWQFERLREQGKVRFGKRYTIYSPLDKQACADHDRASGEGIQPQEYSAIKLVLQRPYPKAMEGMKISEDVRVTFLCATLRPETMFGQTNFWVLPSGKYGVYASDRPDEVYICSDAAAQNLSFQGHSPSFGKVVCFGTLKGDDVIGCLVKAPLVERPIRALPLTTIAMSKGTGVVTCVPTDAPDDWIMLKVLKEDEKLRARYGVLKSWLDELEYIEIIETKFGRRSADAVIKEMGITGVKDKQKLQAAKELVYREGFYKGKMVVPGYEGKDVLAVKDQIKELLLVQGDLILYAQPEGEVISRSGDKCAVAMLDQWYIPYGEGQWKEDVLEHIESMTMYMKETKDSMIRTVEWLKQWACSRSFGLGTHLPWDPQYVIESLSDSTIYMAFYTFSHLLQGIDNLDGSKPGPAGLLPEQMTSEVWDFVLLGKEPAKEVSLPVKREILENLRNEYLFWYPLDLRVSGKDLIGNHLVFWLYNHLAILGKGMSPRGLRTNGFLLMNNMKMSKQTGNFLSLTDAIDRFGVDATRVGLADAGDGSDDANFVEDTANSAILRLTSMIDFALQFVEAEEKMAVAEDGSLGFHARVFENAIRRCVAFADSAYARLMFRDALRHSFFDLNIARDNYRSAVGGLQFMDRRVVRLFVESQVLLMAPITTHVCEYIWTEVLKKSASVLFTPFPESEPLDARLFRVSTYLESLIGKTRKKLAREMQLAAKMAKKNQKAVLKKFEVSNRIVFYVQTEFPPFLLAFREKICELFEKLGSMPGEKDVLAAVKTDDVLRKHVRKLMEAFVEMRDDFELIGKDVFESKLPFNELDVLMEQKAYLLKSLDLKKLDVALCSDVSDSEDVQNRRADALPGNPACYFCFDERLENRSD